MPSIAVSKDQINNYPEIPHAVYTLTVNGFKPKFAKDKGSINLQPQLQITGDVNGNPVPKFRDPKDPKKELDINGQTVFSNLNSSPKAVWIMESFVHSTGNQMVDKGDYLDIPGKFDGPEDDPTRWTYTGPLVNTTIKAIVKMRPNQSGGGSSPQIDEFICAVPGCDKKHAMDLAK